MKLFELLERQEPKIDFRPRQIKNIDVLKAGTMGQGLQAVVGKTKGNTVIKKAAIYGNNDAYLQYVALIAEHQDNPFFPQIYSAKVFQEAPPEDVKGYAKGQMYLVVHMERLHEINNPKIKDAVEEQAKRLGIGSLEDVTLDDEYDRKSIAGDTNNPQLKEALELMEPLFQYYGSDMHLGNWMVRLTSTGPQLVFADPFFGA